jgi:hypothetical protein
LVSTGACRSTTHALIVVALPTVMFYLYHGHRKGQCATSRNTPLTGGNVFAGKLTQASGDIRITKMPTGTN